MSGERPMPGCDAAWLRLDQPTNRMIITSVMTFDDPLDLGLVRRRVLDRVVTPFAPFRQVVSGGGSMGGPQWRDAPLFDPGLHFHHLGLRPPGDRAALQELVGDLMSLDLDASKPLWDVYLVDGYGAGCALITRVHHCIADGIALARVMLGLADEAEGAAAAGPPVPRAGHGALAGLTGPVRRAAGLGSSVAATLAHESVATLLHPARLLEIAREVRDDASALVTLLTSPGDPATVLKHDHGVALEVAWTPPIPLPAVKDIAHASATTVNDVLLAALSGALDRHLAGQGDEVEELHVMVPFNVRPAGEPLPAELGNAFGLVIAGLPLRGMQPRARLMEIHRRMAAIKASRQPAVSYATLGALGHVPGLIEDRFMRFMSAKSTAVVTNVPGPAAPMSLTGVPVREVLVWAPCAGSIGMSVSMFSYRDTVTVGFMTHGDDIASPGELAGHLVAALAELSEAVQAHSSS